MDISIIISGNLTGFSRFYTSPKANDAYDRLDDKAKFDFDFRNYLTFLNFGEKVYAISFSKEVIAVSLVTRILDSFRRAGVLVVTALIPRNQLVSAVLDPSDKAAVYRLLNEINDRFYEKNYANGVINQNPVVLMQDYYSDIIARYTLASGRARRSVNESIDVASPNKRIGYVAASANDMPKYLASVIRKSYSGYHHVFFGENVPQNIDEPAEEVILYKVRVENGKRHIPGEVRLTDKIPNINPEQGERPLSNTNFTYGQVINGEAGTDISAFIDNDTIVLSFHFKKEEKTIRFKFYEGASEIAIPLIRPQIVDTNGMAMPISTESFTFYGKEIYGLKTIKCGNADYVVDPTTQHVDLQRCSNGAIVNVCVLKGWTWRFNPTVNNRPAVVNPVSFTFRNKFTNEHKTFDNITKEFTLQLGGRPDDWEVKVDSDYYESKCVPATAQIQLVPKRSAGTQAAYAQQNARNNRRGVTPVYAGVNSGGGEIQLTEGGPSRAEEQHIVEEEKKKRIIKYAIIAVAAICVVCIGWWGLSKLIPSKSNGNGAGAVIVQPKELQTKNVAFCFLDSDGDKMNDTYISLLTVTFEPDSIIEKSKDGKGYVIKYDEEASPAEKIAVKEVTFHDVNLLKKDFRNELEIRSLGDTVRLPLSVKTSDIKLYQDIEKIEDSIKSTDYDAFKKRVDGVLERNEAYSDILNGLLESKKSFVIGGNVPGAGSKTPPVSRPAIPPVLDGTTLDTATLRGMTGPTYQTPEARARIAALKRVLNSIVKGECPKSSDGLSAAQKEIVDELIKLKNDIDALPETSEYAKTKKSSYQGQYSYYLRAGKDGKVSLNTAYTAVNALRQQVDEEMKKNEYLK